MKFKLVLTVILCALGTFLAIPLTPTEAKAATCLYQGSNNAEIAERMREIGDKYEVGDILDEADAEYVTEHFSFSTQPQPRQSWSFTKTGSAYGTSVLVSGDIFNNGSFSYSWGGKLTATKTAGGTPRRMVGNIRCEAYGLMGSDGVLGKIYDQTITSSVSNSNLLSMNQSRTFTGVAAVQYMSAWVDVTTSGGQVFTIQGDIV